MVFLINNKARRFHRALLFLYAELLVAKEYGSQNGYGRNNQYDDSSA